MAMSARVSSRRKPAARRRTAAIFSIACVPRPACELEIIDRETEARLAAHGCASLLDPGARRRDPVRHRRRLL
jgi:hypothetical protein